VRRVGTPVTPFKSIRSGARLELFPTGTTALYGAIPPLGSSPPRQGDIPPLRHVSRARGLLPSRKKRMRPELWARNSHQ